MKKFNVLSALLVLFTALSLTSCSDDAATLDPSGQGFNSASLNVAFNNNLYTADNVTANVSGGTITITGSRGPTGEAITMSLGQTQLTIDGIYNDNVSVSYLPGGGSTTEYMGYNPETGESTGAIKITALDTISRTISGNFAFVGYSSTNPTAEPIPFYSGSFNNVPYTGNQLPAAIIIPPVTPPAEGTEYLKAKVDAELKEFTLLQAIPLNQKVNISGTIVSPQQNIGLILDQAVEPGTYEMVDSPFDGAVGTYNVGTNMYTSTSGQITIISNADGWIKGTFHFSAVNGNDDTDVIEVTEGDFNIQVD